MDWSPTEEGRLVTGDCGNCVYVTRTAEGGWATDPVPFVGHMASVEDLQWSPTETTVSILPAYRITLCLLLARALALLSCSPRCASIVRR